MGKVIFWMVIVFAVLFVLRLYNVSQQKKRERAARDDRDPRRDKASGMKDGGPGEVMVRCERCGIFLPRSEAQLVSGAVRCRGTDCAAHGH